MRKQITSLFHNSSRRLFLAGAVGLVFGAIGQSAFAAGSTIGAKEAFAKAKSGEIILVDIRTPQEWADTGIGQGAIGLDMTVESFVDSLLDLRKNYPEKPIALICRTGNRSSYVLSHPVFQNFPDLVDVTEGMAGGRNGKGWIPRGLPVYAGSKTNVEKFLKAIITK